MSTKNQASNLSELNALRELSGRLGRNPLLAQASSGNTSIKIDDVLWIKASGKWLIQADAEDFLVPVPLTEAQRCLRGNRAIHQTVPNSQGRTCASIETAMHAVLPQRVVIHVHSVNAIAWAVSEDGPHQLSTRLSGLPWQWIPYTSSGASLAREIAIALSRASKTTIFVLGNHGLVVSGNSCHAAEQLLLEVEQRLIIPLRPAPPPNEGPLQRILAGSVWSLPADAGVHSLATDSDSRRILAGGVLYPCQALFLPGMPGWASSRLFHEPLCDPQRYSTQRVLFVDNHGILVKRQMTRAEREMLVGLTNVVQRIHPSASIRYLTEPEVSDVLNGSGEQYRRSANTNGSPNTSHVDINRAAIRDSSQMTQKDALLATESNY
jgi:ribulose-5-phosphate 4-epimerase/fuculose-1-phosphate aldolase